MDARVFQAGGGLLKGVWFTAVTPVLLLATILGWLAFSDSRSALAQTPPPLVIDAVSAKGRLIVLAAGLAPTDQDGSIDWLALRNYRLYQSSDQGHTWTTRSAAGLQFAFPSGLAIDPNNVSNLFAIGPMGVFFQEDDKVWRQVSTGPLPARIYDLAIDTIDLQHWYAATTGDNPVRSSQDGGQTWEGLGLLSVGGSGQEVLLTPDGRTLFVIQSHPGAGGTSLYHRNPDGVWRNIPRPATFLSGLAYEVENSSLYVGSNYGGYGLDPGAVWRWQDDQWSKVRDFGQQKVKVMGLDPGPPKTLYANVGGELRRSADGGQTWQPLATLPLVPAALPEAAGLKAYYDGHDGWRVLGRPLTGAFIHGGLPAQYFEKGRLEDHSAQQLPDPNWRYMYGLLVDELQNAQTTLPVGGETCNVTYATIHSEAAESRRQPPPAGFKGGVWPNPDGSVFIPYDAHLRPVPGYTVHPRFWTFMQRSDLFPGGWLHDIGLPLTEAIWAKVTKGSLGERQILVQVLQRAVLTLDPANPEDWQVELANVGTDYAKAFPQKVSN